MVGDLIQTLENDFVVAARLAPRFEGFLDFRRQHAGLLDQFAGAAAGSGMAAIGARPLDAVELLGCGFESLGQLSDQCVLRSQLVHQSCDLLGT